MRVRSRSQLNTHTPEPRRYIIMDVWEKKDGMLLPRISAERWEELKSFPLRPDDVFIATYPKSGTTWMQQIVKLLRTGGTPDDARLDKSVPWMEIMDSDMGKRLGYTSDLLQSPDLLSPRAFKSHLTYELIPGGLPHTTQAKYVYVMRNPKDVIVSMWYHWNNKMRENRTWDEHYVRVMSGESQFGTWFNHVLGWWSHHKDAPNILFIKYEDMKTDLLAVIRSVARFIGIQNASEELLQSVVENSTFESMKQDTSCNYNWHVGPEKVFKKEDFIRKGEVGDWRNHFTEEQVKDFDRIYATRMAGTDLTFKFVISS